MKHTPATRNSRKNQLTRGIAGLVLAACLGLPLPIAFAQDGDDGLTIEEPSTQPADEMIEFSDTSEPIELMTMVDFVTEELGINVSVKGTIVGSVMFNARQQVPRSELLSLLEALLAQYNYSLTLDPVGIYLIQPASEITQSFEGEFATTKIISTPNVKPSALKAVIDPTGGGGGGQGSSKISYVDDLGIIVVTDTPRRVRAIEELVRLVLEEYGKTTFTRIDLKYVAANAARERAVTLVGQSGTLRNSFPGQEQNVQIPGTASSIDNLPDRLIIDSSGNALIFRGTEAEIAQVRAVLEIIDVPTTLTPKEYKAGANAAMIANIASQRGLGEVIKLEETDGSPQQFFNNRFNQNQNQNQQQSTLGGGSVMMVDEVRGTILYYGTPEQQEQLAALIDALDVADQEIVIERYAVKNVGAEELADLLQAIIENQSQADGGILPGARGNQNTQGGPGAFQRFLQDQQGGSENAFDPTAENSFVTFHEATNVVIVKAPAKLQAQFARIIGEIDVRRPQVYVEVQILAVSNSKDFRLAIEGQINAGQFFTQTAFGLGSVGEGGVYGSPKLPLAGLGGYSASLIKSQYVPVILDAVQTNTDARILSSPQLLVNDNEEAEIESIEEQPTTTTTFSTGGSDQTSFGGYESAGTKLTITPSISEAGYLRLAYEIELSSFTGPGADGIPPPKTTHKVRSDSVTIPTDTTIVVGGIEVQDSRNTVVKVPGLGDIPLLGLLFRDTNKITSEQVLYIFITPRILNDRNFADLRLLTRGPQEYAEIDSGLPDLEPSMIELIRPTAWSPDTAPTADPAAFPIELPTEPSTEEYPLIIPLTEGGK